MFVAIFTAIYDALPIVLAFGLLALGLWGFWQGLGMRPHKDGNRPPPLSKYFWWAND